MPKEYDNNNTGALFKNKHKEEGDSKPDYTGTAEVNGEKKRMAAWLKKSEKVGTFMSIQFTDPEDSPKKEEPKRKPRPDDDVPF